MSPPSVLHVINRVTPTGGAEVSLVQTLPLLAERGVRQGLVTLHEDSDRHAVAQLESSGVRVYECEAPRAWSAVQAVRTAIADFKPQVVHSTLWEADRAARPAAKLAGVPTIASLVNAVVEHERLPKSIAWKVLLLRKVDVAMARHLTDSFHAISQAAAQDMHRRAAVPMDRITVVPRGRDRRVLGFSSVERRRAMRAALGVEPSAPVLLNVGRQERQKGQVLLVEAFADVVRRRPEAILCIAGREGAATTALLERLSALGLGDSVRLLGPRRDVADLLCAADVFAFSSLWEGLGGAVLEAMALDVPVVAFDDPAVAEVLGDTGLLVPMADATALGEALLTTLEDREGARGMAARARRRFDDEFEIQKVVDRLVRLYEPFDGAGLGRRRP